MTNIVGDIDTTGLDKVREYSAVCDQLYQDVKKDRQVLGWTVCDTKKDFSGFYGAILKKDNDYLIVYRGTNEIKDWISNTFIGLSIRGRQFMLADELYKKLIKDCPEKDKITIAGHSLGGGLAEYIGATYGIKTFTFNGIGIKHYLKAKIIKDNDFSNIINFMSVVDLVGNLLPHTTSRCYYVKQPEFILNNEESLKELKKKIFVLQKLATSIVGASSYFHNKILDIYNSAKNWLYKSSAFTVFKVIKSTGLDKTFMTLAKKPEEEADMEKADKAWFKVAHGLEFFININEKDIEYLEKNCYLSPL